MATIISRSGTDLQIGITDWLLHSNIRIRSGRHAGAIAGWLNEEGEAEFAYPEITGYYLSWLASVAVRRPDVDVRPAASAAVDWLHSVTSKDRLPATRYYFDSRDDWRNNATFTFDLAMLCRGLHAVRRLVPPQPRTTVLNTLLRSVLPTGDVLPVSFDVRGELPDRWSTRPGPFQLKTAAVLRTFRESPAFWRILDRWSGRLLGAIDRTELHPALYALEGLVQFGVSGKPDALPEAARCFEAILPEVDDARSDVVAQALRLGCVLTFLGFLPRERHKERLAELSFRLEGFIAESGAVLFRRPGYAPVHWNAWAAIFAHQYFAMSTRTNPPAAGPSAKR